MAVPKCKVSKARRDKRRGSNWKLSAPSVAVCPKCGENDWTLGYPLGTLTGFVKF